MAEPTPGLTQQIAGDIFGEMVLQEAIKDKTAMMENQLRLQHGGDTEQDQQETAFEEHLSEHDDDLDDLMDEESEKIMRSLKEQRMEALKADYQEKQQNKTLGHGTYTEIVESEFLPLVTKTRYVVVAFFHKDFQRCKIIDMHLFKICRDHEEARFVRLDAEKAPFFISKLGIQVLPTVVMFIDGIAQDRIVGFEELGGCDDFSTLVLTRRLIKGGVLYANNRKEAGQIKIKKGSRRNADSDEDY